MNEKLLAIKDNYMRRKYSDSSDEETTVNIFDLKNWKAGKSHHSLKSPQNQARRKDHDTIKEKEKPLLNIQPRSEKIAYNIEKGVQIPAEINQYLHEYQKEGVVFLWNHYKEKKGCILADDMGLGKTIQIFSLFATIHASKPKKQPIFLVVAPTSVLYNWSDEIDVWVNLRTGMFHRKNKDKVIEQAKNGELDVVLTTHETMRLYLDLVGRVFWSIVVFDEAHRIKEEKSLLTQAAKSLPSLCRIGLTGTPLQNNLKELWCILDWANHGCLGTSKNFEERFEKPITYGQRFDVTKRELATARKRQQELTLLHSDWMLRRTKDMIQNELPRKDEKIVFCPMTSLQRSIYEEILKLPKCLMLVGLDKKCKCGSGLIGRSCCMKKFDWRKYLFPFIQTFLKLSNHIGLILPQTSTKKKNSSELAEEICEHLRKNVTGFKEVSTDRSFARLTSFTLCGKMTVLHKLLSVFQKKNDKVLIFSHSTKLLNILEAYIIGRGVIYRRIDGQTQPKQRHEIMKEFNADSSIFICLLSTLVGSLGMNFTGANIVIIFDPLWNPAYEQQAQDRAYRIGQRRDVAVYRLLSVGSIEENIYMRQIYKQQLANIAVERSAEHRYFSGVSGDSRHRGELFGISNMFKFGRDHNSSFAKKVFGKTRQNENDVATAKYEPILPEKSTDNNLTSHAEDGEGLKDNGDDYITHASQCAEDILENDEETCADEVENDTKHDDLVEKILYGFDVSIAHSSKSLIGSSKREEKLSDKAIRDVFWKGLNSQDAANTDNSNIEESQDINVGEVKTDANPPQENEKEISGTTRMRDKHMFERIGNTMFIIGGTPSHVIGQQFEELAKTQGLTVKEFARFIVNNSEMEARNILRNYYTEKNPLIRKVSSLDRIYNVNTKPATPTKRRHNEETSMMSLTSRNLKRKLTTRKKRMSPCRPLLTYKCDDVIENVTSSSDEIIDESESENFKNSPKCFTSIKKPKLFKDKPTYHSNNTIEPPKNYGGAKILGEKPENQISHFDLKRSEILVENTVEIEEKSCPKTAETDKSIPVITETTILDDLLAFNSFKRPKSQNNTKKPLTDADQKYNVKSEYYDKSEIPDIKSDFVYESKRRDNELLGKSILDELLGFKSPIKKRTSSNVKDAKPDIAMATTKQSSTRRMMPSTSLLDELMG